MCSELFRIPLAWHSVLLGLWIGGGLLALVLMAKRSGWTSDMAGFLPGYLLGIVAIALVPTLFPEGIPVRGYGLMVLVGALTGLWMATRRARQVGLEPEVIFSLAFGMFICGILCARLFYVIEYWPTRFQFNKWSTTLLEIVKFTEGGLVIYGAFIGATLAFVAFVKKHHLPALALADVIAPSLVAGLAFGRIGCLLNGCCYGGETDKPWAVTFPRDSIPYMEQVIDGRMFGLRLKELSATDPRPVVVESVMNVTATVARFDEGSVIVAINDRPVNNLAEAQQEILHAFDVKQSLRLQTESDRIIQLASIDPTRSFPVHPTQLYSAINAVLMAWLLWSFYPFRLRDGEVTALMLTLYPVARFLLEIIRIDESAVFGTGLSISQNISILLLAGAIVLWLWLRSQPPGRAGFKQPVAS